MSDKSLSSGFLSIFWLDSCLVAFYWASYNLHIDLFWQWSPRFQDTPVRLCPKIFPKVGTTCRDTSSMGNIRRKNVYGHLPPLTALWGVDTCEEVPMQETKETWVRSLIQEYSLEENMANLLQYSRMENPMDRGAWWAIVHRVTKSRTPLKRLSTCTFLSKGFPGGASGKESICQCRRCKRYILHIHRIYQCTFL